jgi:hypothetical protein
MVAMQMARHPTEAEGGGITAAGICLLVTLRCTASNVAHVLLLRSPVLLVDTVKPGWPVLHANSSWHKLLQQQRQQATSTWQSVAAGGSNTATSNSSSSSASSLDVIGQLLWPILAGQLYESNVSTPSTGLMQADQQQQVVPEQVQQQQQHHSAELAHQQRQAKQQEQQQQQQQQQNIVAEQVRQLVAERQCFTLAGLQLPGLMAQPVTLSFRCVLWFCESSTTCYTCRSACYSATSYAEHGTALLWTASAHAGCCRRWMGGLAVRACS